MAVSISGHVALITGASSGIGRAIAHKLAAEGCRLALIARNALRLDSVAAECKALGAEALPLSVDVTDRHALTAAVQQIDTRFGALNILVYAAGVYSLASADEQDLDASDEILNVNLRGAIYSTRLCLPHIIAGCGGTVGRGALIYVASMSGKRSYGGASAYCASKFGVVGYASGVWDDVRAHNIKVCAICPGYVNTPMVAGVPLAADHMIQPEDVAELARLVACWPDSSCPNEILVNMQRTSFPR